MSELISSVELRKSDGQPIIFNFQFENGLPIKPIIDVEYLIGLTQETKEIVVMCYFKDEKDYLNLNISIENISIFDVDVSQGELWIHFKDAYIILHVDKKYLVLLEQKNSYFQFYDCNKNLLKSLYNNIC